MPKKPMLLILSLLCIFFACTGDLPLNYNLTIESDAGGATEPAGTISVESGQLTSITATAEQGFTFAGWTVTEGSDVVLADSNNSQTSVTLNNGDACIRAGFTQLTTTGQPPLQYEYHTLTYEQGIQWGDIRFTHTYQSPPVVIMGALSSKSSTPAMLRVDDVTVSGFHFKVDTWNDLYAVQPYAEETFSYLVFEEGTHSLFNGALTVIAGKTLLNRSWETVTFPVPFAEADPPPVILSQCMAHTDMDYYSVVTRQRNITHEGFEIELQERAVNTGINSHQPEITGWLALSQQYSSVPGMRFEVLRNNIELVNHEWKILPFHNRYIRQPLVLACMQTTNGSAPAAIRFNNLSETGIELFIQEDPTTTEPAHSPEAIGYICIEQE